MMHYRPQLTIIPPRSTWSTQLEDPRLNKLPEQVSQLNVFLKTAKSNIRQKEAQISDLERRIKLAELELQRLTDQGKKASTKGPVRFKLDQDIAAKQQEIADYRQAIAKLRDEAQYDQEGVLILEDVGTRMDVSKGYGLEEARATVTELNHMRAAMAKALAERERLEYALRQAVSGNTWLPTYEEVDEDDARSGAMERVSKKEFEEILKSAHAKDDADLRVCTLIFTHRKFELNIF